MSPLKVGDKVRVQDNAPDEYAKWRSQRGIVVGLNVVRGSTSFRKVGEPFDTSGGYGTQHLVQFFEEGQGTQAIDEHWLSKID